MAALPAQPPKEASPAKQSASTLKKPLTNGVNSLLLARDQDVRLHCHLPAPPVERRHHDGLSWDYLPVSFSADETSIVKDFQRHVMPLVRPSWTEKLLRHRVFEDGVTNKLLGFFREDPGASSSADDSTAVLVRVNGEGRELVVDGETEILVILTLHKSGLCPPLYLVTENALCYGYIPGRALNGNEMQCEEVLEATSRALARYHSIPPPPSISGRGPWVWRQARTWMKLASESLHTDDLASPRFKQVFGTVDELRLEMEWLGTFLRAPSTDWPHVANGSGTHYPTITTASDSEEEGSERISQSACVLCHNDPQPLNFVKTPTGSVVLIDMEYSDVNYAAFDVGAFFCEFAGVHGTLDYSRYPSEAFQKKWIRSYLHECARIKGLSQATVSDAEVDGLYKDANNFAMVAHFIWSLWSLIQSKNSKINFDYLDYGCARYTEFKRRKSIIISQL